MNLSPLYDAFKSISCHLRNSDIVNLGKDTSAKNTSNDIQKHIDILANNIIIDAAKKIPEIVGIVSEEDEKFITFKTNFKQGYVLIFDPLDGSKNVFSNNTVGTIYGIYKYDEDLDEILSIYETGYALYGPSTILVRTVDNSKVNQYYLDSKNNFAISRELKLNKKNTICSINLSYNIDEDAKSLVRHLIGKGSTQRWSGAMVADAHQVIMRGGTFIYPQNDNNPNGKIRFLYEAVPFAFIFNLLGGTAIDHNRISILTKLPHTKLKTNSMIHGEVPIILSTVHTTEEINDIIDINDLIKC